MQIWQFSIKSVGKAKISGKEPMNQQTRIVSEFLNLKTLAVVGASRNRAKYGNAVYRHLRRRGYTVYAVNPKAQEVEGDPAYPDLRSLPQPVEGVVFVVPPQQTERILREAYELGVRYAWMQPGAESEKALRYCQENGIRAVAGPCILVVG